MPYLFIYIDICLHYAAWEKPKDHQPRPCTLVTVTLNHTNHPIILNIHNILKKI